VLALFGIRLRPVVQETGWAPRPVWTGTKISSLLGIGRNTTEEEEEEENYE